MTSSCKRRHRFGLALRPALKAALTDARFELSASKSAWHCPQQTVPATPAMTQCTDLFRSAAIAESPDGLTVLGAETSYQDSETFLADLDDVVATLGACPRRHKSAGTMHRRLERALRLNAAVTQFSP